MPTPAHSEEEKMASVQMVDENNWTVWIGTKRLISVPSKSGADDVANTINTALSALQVREGELERERDEAWGWVRWLVQQAADDSLSLQERVSIVEHFPARSAISKAQGGDP